MIPDHPQRDYRGLRILVMGLGSFGGGLGVVKFLAQRGAQITITDARPADKLADAIEELREIAGLQFRLGGHADDDFRNSDLIVVNPAVRPDHSSLNLARSIGVPLTSEMNLFWQWNPAPVVAVTGSNGKSTTTALIHSILRKSGQQVWLGGNIGVSLLPQIEQIRSQDVVVLELSSFQLTDLDRLQASPHVSVVTNFAPNHLDWHPTLDHYRWAKQSMLRWQNSTDIAILNADDADVCDWPSPGQRLHFGLQDTGRNGAFATPDQLAVIRQLPHSRSLPLRDWLRLPGRHNLSNALAATIAATQFGVSDDAIQRGLTEYQPLPHRLQWIADVEGRSFYNDSLATTPESAIVGLEAFERPVVLLAGGYDKHVDLTQMAKAIAARAKAVALMGQTAELLRDGILRDRRRRCVLSPTLTNFREAFDWAFTQSSSGDVILLSPGCASYDWFRNFADRGQQFTGFVQQLSREQSQR